MKEDEVVNSSPRLNEKTDDPPSFEHKEKKDGALQDLEGRGPNNLNAVFQNPLAGIPREQLFKNVHEFCSKFDLLEDLETFKKGALVSQNPETATQLPDLNEFEREALIREHTHKWHQPWQLYWLASMFLLNQVNGHQLIVS
jgi:hypothetical protein